MNRRILIVQFDSNLTGSAFSGLLLADGLREAGWETTVAFGHEGPMVDRYRSAGHDVKIAPHKNWIRTDRFLHFIKVLKEERAASKTFESLIEEIKPEVVYINTSVSYAAARAARKLGYPVIWHIRELFADVGGEMKVPFGFKRRVRSVFENYANQLVAISQAVATNMLGETKRPIHIIPNAVSSAFFEDDTEKRMARSTFGLPENKKVVGVPGTLRPMKGHAFFFRSMVPLIKKYPDLVIAVTGGGEAGYVKELHQLTDSLGIRSSVKFLGYIENMTPFYKACDVACIPSVTEPFGRTVIEAFATGTPVVASAVGGINEIVDPEENGLLVPYGDEEAMGQALETVLNDPDLAERLASSALQKARSHYHEAVYKTRICEVVSSLTGAQSRLEPAVAS